MAKVMHLILNLWEDYRQLAENLSSHLANGRCQRETKHEIEGLILGGGTELPLILRYDEHNGVRLLYTTRIHCD